MNNISIENMRSRLPSDKMSSHRISRYSYFSFITLISNITQNVEKWWSLKSQTRDLHYYVTMYPDIKFQDIKTFLLWLSHLNIRKKSKNKVSKHTSKERYSFSKVINSAELSLNEQKLKKSIEFKKWPFPQIDRLTDRQTSLIRTSTLWVPKSKVLEPSTQKGTYKPNHRKNSIINSVQQIDPLISRFTKLYMISIILPC